MAQLRGNDICVIDSGSGRETGRKARRDLGRQQMAPVQLPEGFEVIALSVSLKVQDSIPIDYGSGLTER